MQVLTPDKQRLPLNKIELLRRTADPRILRLIILPTEKCNFRCTYCYEDFAIGKMSRGLIEGLKKLLAERIPQLTALSISWFGGEPLLAKDIIYEINGFCLDAIHASHSPLRFHSGITTNAYFLNAQVLEKLLHFGLTDFQITLDGPREVHNATRKLAKGGETFDAIWGNLLSLANIRTARNDISVDLRIHYDKITAYELDSLVEDVCTQLMPSGRFAVKFHEIEKLGGSNDSLLRTPGPREHEYVRKLNRKILDAKPSFVSQVSQDISDYICYAAMANSLVIRADGRIGKCTVALADPRNDIGKLQECGSIIWSGNRIAPWLRGINSADRSTLACPLHGMEELPAPKLDQKDHVA